MKSIKAILLVFVFSSTAAQVSAMPIDFTFSFADSFENTMVTGIIRGLVDDTADQAASSVEIVSSSGGFGVGEPTNNAWTVVNGGTRTTYFYRFDCPIPIRM